MLLSFQHNCPLSTHYCHFSSAVNTYGEALLEMRLFSPPPITDRHVILYYVVLLQTKGRMTPILRPGRLCVLQRQRKQQSDVELFLVSPQVNTGTWLYTSWIFSTRLWHQAHSLHFLITTLQNRSFKSNAHCCMYTRLLINDIFWCQQKKNSWASWLDMTVCSYSAWAQHCRWRRHPPGNLLHWSQPPSAAHRK